MANVCSPSSLWVFTYMYRMCICIYFCFSLCVCVCYVTLLCIMKFRASWACSPAGDASSGSLVSAPTAATLHPAHVTGLQGPVAP